MGIVGGGVLVEITSDVVHLAAVDVEVLGSFEERHVE